MTIRNKYIFVILSLLIECQSTLAKNNDIKEEMACSFESLSTFRFNLPVDLTKKSFDSTKYSTEGAHIDAYFADKLLVKTEILIYGETSKTQIEYVFNSSKNYIVNHTRHYYSSPIYVKNSRIMATNRTQYLVCDGKQQKIVDQSDIQKKVDSASQLLKDILRQLKPHKSGQGKI